jgi:protein-disulfide isomerase
MRVATRALATVLLVLAASCTGRWGDVAGPDQRVTVELGTAPTRGPADAPVVIVEFGDFQCPYCGDMEPVVQRLLADYDGQILFAFKQFPIEYHRHARLASEASLAAHAQGQFWPYHDLLYANQDALERADLEAYAAEVGLDLDLFRADLDAGTWAVEVDDDYWQGINVGVTGTPAFYINGRAAFGALPYDLLKDVVEEELALAGR